MTYQQINILDIQTKSLKFSKIEDIPTLCTEPDSSQVAMSVNNDLFYKKQKTLHNPIKKFTSMKIRCEYDDISVFVETLDIFEKKDYIIIKKIKSSGRKASYIVKNKVGEKFFFKAKLKDFMNDNEILVYKNIKKYPHQNINKIISILQTDKMILVISEYLDGFDMSQGKYYEYYDDDIMKIFIESLHGLQHLHLHEIIHGDIKPANIMIIPYKQKHDLHAFRTLSNGSHEGIEIKNLCRLKSDSVKYMPIIIDFDLSRLSADKYVNKSSGSKGFVPPEVHRGIISTKSDIWSLGMTFYYFIFRDKIKCNKVTEIIEDEYIDISFIVKNSFNSNSYEDKTLTDAQLKDLRKCFGSFDTILTNMLDKDMNKRKNVCELLELIM